jgi:hypothetical protein
MQQVATPSQIHDLHNTMFSRAPLCVLSCTCHVFMQHSHTLQYTKLFRTPQATIFSLNPIVEQQTQTSPLSPRLPPPPPKKHKPPSPLHLYPSLPLLFGSLPSLHLRPPPSLPPLPSPSLNLPLIPPPHPIYTLLKHLPNQHPIVQLPVPRPQRRGLRCRERVDCSADQGKRFEF